MLTLKAIGSALEKSSLRRPARIVIFGYTYLHAIHQYFSHELFRAMQWGKEIIPHT